MKNTILFIITLVFSCSSNSKLKEVDIETFKNLSKNYQSLYMNGSENCEGILLSMNKNIKMSEISFSGALKSYTYDELKQFCPHLPNKRVIHTII